MDDSNSAVAGALPGTPQVSRSAASRLRLSQAWAVASVLVPVLVITGTPLVAIDLAYQVRAGALMLDTHSLLRTDPFTATAAGSPWLNQQWLAQILLATVFRLGGWLGLAVLRAALAGLVMTFVFMACRAAGASTKRAAWLTLPSGALLPFDFQVRPQLFALVCFAATAWLVARRRTRPGGQWLVVPITVLWANMHGTFFLAPLLLGLAWIEDRWSRGHAAPTALLAGVGSVLATMVNPYGPRVWSYVAGLANHPVIRGMVQEWKPPTIGSYTGAVFFLSLVAAAVLLIARVRRPVPWVSLLPLAVFLSIALAAIRGVYWWAIAVPTVLARVLQDRPARSEQLDPASALNAAIVGLLTMGIVAMLIPWLPYTGRSMPTERQLVFAPMGITRELHGILTPGQVLFNAQIWGSWLEFEFPRNPVIVDSRIEVVPTSVWSNYNAVSRGSEGWQAILDSWHVDVAVLARDQQHYLIPRMKADPGWRLVYEDAEGLIFARDGRYSCTSTDTRPAFAATRMAATRVPTPSLP
ncbi:MAG: hypothetical protein ACRDHS_11600 [Actinomycetota bacterium]